MVFQNWLKNIRAFFRLVAEAYRIWFTPYHYDGDEEGAEEPAESAAADSSSEAAATQSEPVEETAPAESTVAVESSPAPLGLAEMLAFRGAMSKVAMAAALGQTVEQLEGEISSLLETQVIADAGNGRYVLASDERRSRLRANSHVADWLARLQRSDLEDDVLAVIDHLCGHLPVKIKPGDKLVLYLRQDRWMVWESQPEVCRVRIYGTLWSRHLPQLRKVDRRFKSFRVRRPHDWHIHDWVAFRWQAGADTGAIQSLLVELGEIFFEHTRGRGHGGGRRKQPPQQPDSPPTEEQPLI